MSTQLKYSIQPFMLRIFLEARWRLCWMPLDGWPKFFVVGRENVFPMLAGRTTNVGKKINLKSHQTDRGQTILKSFL